MDIKRLHDAIRDLRAELEKVNLAIQQIEKLAAVVSGEKPSGNESKELMGQLAPRPDELD